jgi:HSP20 family protein
MTLVKFNNRNRLIPWTWSNDRLKDFLSSEEFFDEDFIEGDGFMPAMNIIDHKKNIEVEFAAPGFNKKDFEVTIEGNILHVCGEKRNEKEEKDGDFTRQEFSYNAFRRSLRLPENVNENAKIKAHYKRGILTLTLPKNKLADKEPLKSIVIS